MTQQVKPVCFSFLSEKMFSWTFACLDEEENIYIYICVSVISRIREREAVEEL